MAADLHYSPARRLGAAAVCGGFLVLVLAILPFPFPRTITAVSAIALVLSAIAVKRGAAHGGTTSAFGIVGTALASVALLVGGTSVITAPEPYIPPPPPEAEAGEGEQVPPEPTVENTVPPEVVRLAVYTVTATSTAADGKDDDGNSVSFAPVNVTDGDRETAWRTRGTGVGESLTFTFSQSVHLDSMGVVPGYAKIDPKSGTDRFLQNRRVERAIFSFGNGFVKDFSFEDDREIQVNAVNVDTTSVRVDIYASTNQAERDFTAISEIEFYGWVN